MNDTPIDVYQVNEQDVPVASNRRSSMAFSNTDLANAGTILLVPRNPYRVKSTIAFYVYGGLFFIGTQQRVTNLTAAAFGLTCAIEYTAEQELYVGMLPGSSGFVSVIDEWGI